MESRGRPRDATRDVAILDTVRQMLLEVGYDRLSIDGVAARSGVAKTTIYRRYPGKAALVTAAVDRRMGPALSPQTECPTDLRTVLLKAVGWLSTEISTQGTGLLNAMFAAMRSDQDLAASMRRMLDRDTEELTRLLSSYAIRGSAPLSQPTAALIAEVAPAMIVRRLTVVGLPCDDAFLDHLVDDVLIPLVPRS